MWKPDRRDCIQAHELNLLIAKWSRAQRKGIPRFSAQDLRLQRGLIVTTNALS
jgi:hypothetical protein